MRDVTVAKDGLLARKTGDYAREKLDWLEEYFRAALSATTKKLDRAYVDLFAGPGVNLSGRLEFEGSPLRALRARGGGQRGPAFTEAFLVNADLAQHQALQKRVSHLVERGESTVSSDKTTLIHGDANLEISGIMQRLHSDAYVFVFADLERPSQFPWKSVEALKAHGHSSVDFYVLFPLEMGIRRRLPYSTGHVLGGGADLTAFFGTDEWKRILSDRTTGSQSPQFHRGITQLYCAQLQKHWDSAKPVLEVNLRGQHGLYRMLFATSHEAAERISTAVARKMKEKGQLKLL